MVIDWFYTLHGIKSWWMEEDGVAAIEAALLFPVLVTLLAGVYDLGTGIILKGRTVTASQIAADLISRNKTANSTSVNDIIAASKLAYDPFGLNGFGIDIASVEFDSRKNAKVLWRQTQAMSPNNTAVTSLNGVGAEGEGMIVVTVQYTYKPLFAHYFTKNFYMSEVAFARGRRSKTVTWES